MIIETTSCPGNSKRMFYDIKSNGRPFYKYLEKEESSYHFSIEVKKEQPENEDKYRYKAEIFIVTINNGSQNGNEYLESISKDLQYTELYDFESPDLLGKRTTNIRSFALKLTLDNKYFIIFAFNS